MNILKNYYTIGLSVVFASIVAPIGAQSEEIPPHGPIPFVAYDKNRNELISEEEFNAVRAKRMAVKATEGRPMRRAASAPSFFSFDTNGDEQLTQAELADGQRAQREKHRGMGQGSKMKMGRNMPAFSEYDLDGDGKILEKEFNEARSKRISERAQQGYQMKNLGSAPSFADIDINGDGKISSEEFATHQSQHRRQKTQ